MSDRRTAVEHACLAWESAGAAAPVDRLVSCRTAVVLPSSGDHPRFCFLSVGSPIESILIEGSSIVGRSGEALTIDALAARLLDDEVAVALAPRKPVAANETKMSLPEGFVARRQQIRHDNVLARFLLRQIGLEEVSSHRGAPAQLYRTLADQWSHDLALCTDPAMMLTLGADRQRYVDRNYTERATDRLPRALGRLHDLGVRAYPRLVIV